MKLLLIENLSFGDVITGYNVIVIISGITGSLKYRIHLVLHKELNQNNSLIVRNLQIHLLSFSDIYSVKRTIP